MKQDNVEKEFGQALALAEKRIIRKAMIYAENNQSKASRLLGISRGTLRTRMKQYFGALAITEKGQ